MSVTTSGSQVEPNGLEIVLDDEAHESLATGHAVITGLAAGPHSVALGGVEPACTVTTTNPLTVNIRSGASTSVVFAVNCPPAPATILVAVTTTVINAPAGFSYFVKLDGAQSQPVASTGRVAFQTVEGEHSVLLSGVPGYCSVGGFGPPQPNPMTVRVAAGRTLIVRFGVLCLG